MTHASLFSGIGGPEVAAAMLGWENLFHCEINPFGRQVLDYWFPDSVSYEDITKTDFTEWRGRIDVLTGGFPCQPFSYAGKRGGREDERYLWPQMLRAIDEIRPTWVVGENVAGLATMVEGGVLTEVGSGFTLFNEGDEFHGYELVQTFTIERICRDLERLGYSVQPVLIPAAAVGAPHRRDRIFILANRNSDDLDRRVSKREVSGTEESESVGYGSRLQYGERYDLRGPLADTNGGHDLRGARANERESVCEGVQERYEVRLAGVADHLRSEVQGVAEDAFGDGSRIREDGHQGNLRNERNAGAGNSERVCKETGIHASDSLCGRGGEGETEIHSRIADGDGAIRAGSEHDAANPADIGLSGAADPRAEAEVCGEVGQERNCPECRLSTAPTSGRRIASYTDGAGLQEPQQPGRGADSKKEGAGLDDRTLRPRGNEDFADAYYARLSAALQSGGYDEKERDDARRSAGMLAHDAWAQGTWWDNFPTVSPVHAGNDGLPVRMDGVSFPASMQPRNYRNSDPQRFNFGRWRTEAIKAYGNAIVPQVMYRIFQAIEQA